VALVGVVVMIGGALASGHLLGDLLALIMTILISAMMVIVRRKSQYRCSRPHASPRSCAPSSLRRFRIRSPQRHMLSAQYSVLGGPRKNDAQFGR
jgi:drug/metabolite transporter (DMT)-like permease